MADFKTASQGFDDVDPPANDIIGNYTGMRICVGYVGAEPKFLDEKELTEANIDAACNWLGLDVATLSMANIAQAVLKWIDAGRPKPKSAEDDELSLSEFF